jgi:hypothetical protein
MITVSVKRAYFDATHFSTDEKGALRVYRGDEVIAEYAADEDITVTQDGAAPAAGTGFGLGAGGGGAFTPWPGGTG